jgi:hypothetical protein
MTDLVSAPLGTERSSLILNTLGGVTLRVLPTAHAVKMGAVSVFSSRLEARLSRAARTTEEVGTTAVAVDVEREEVGDDGEEDGALRWFDGSR